MYTSKKFFVLFFFILGCFFVYTQEESQDDTWIRLSYETSSPADTISILSSDRSKMLYKVIMYEGSHNIDLPIPHGLAKDISSFVIDSSDYGLVKAFITDSPDDIRLTDLSVILDYDNSSPVFICRWAALPDFLVFNFKTYAVQSSYLRRIAFFVEKPGFRGRIASPGEVANLHDWNAHDYPARALAAFFDTAYRNSISLLPAEEELLSILLANKIITKAPDGYLPVSGGLISISRESPPVLRRTLLIHESLHALYFSLPSLRADVYDTWENLLPEARKTFYGFMQWMSYDTKHYPLVATEFFAYMLQQDIEQLRWYINARILPRAASALGSIPAEPEEIENAFLLAAEKMEKDLQKHFPFSAGNTILVSR
ncbi:hypothetical protein WKV44_02700 [Spirochaetia bacterium 38H-sp]|uniref:Peptidase MA-like domain-containing protein n=1 Tax=Rarispira pelagica TaxID=3141764 RepID=A0ABU9U9W4_9SPIR